FDAAAKRDSLVRERVQPLVTPKPPLVLDAIFVPRGVEHGAVRRGLAGRMGIAVHATSAGASAAAEVDAVLERRANRGSGLERALIAGLCGALDPAFKPGDALV